MFAVKEPLVFLMREDLPTLWFQVCVESSFPNAAHRNTSLFHGH
jgi:hypothetical protein